MHEFHRLAARVFGRPHLITAQAAETIAAYLLSRMEGAAAPAADVQRRAPAANRFTGEPVGYIDPVSERFVELYTRVNGTAVVTIEGELVNRGAWIGADSGLTSYEGIAAQIEAAAKDPKASSIILDIDSPGGEATGAMELAALVRRVNAAKPVTAIANGMAASAAYAMASGAGRIAVLPTGLVGSIGVVMLHLDRSGELSKRGIKPTLIHAGEHKVDGHPFGPLPDEVKADLQAEIDGLYQHFVSAVAAGRPGLTEAAIRATEARVYFGADAVKVGLADAVATLDEVVADLNRPRGASQQSRARGKTMAENKPAPDAGADTPDAAAIAEQAAAAAQARIEAVLNHESAAACAPLANHLAFKTRMPAADAGAILGLAAKSVEAAKTATPPAPTAEEQAKAYHDRKDKAAADAIRHPAGADAPAAPAASGWKKAFAAAQGGNL